MINLIRAGRYKLLETKHHTKILHLDRDVFAWLEPRNIGEILVTTHKAHRTDCVLSIGHYRLYDVKDKPDLVDLQHLELEVGKDAWQGYLLPTGLPDDIQKKRRIIPTEEIIAESKRLDAIYMHA